MYVGLTPRTCQPGYTISVCVMMCELLRFSVGRMEIRPTRRKVINYSGKILVLLKSGEVTMGETDCRLFCVQRGNGGGW